jgi:hypothetical protein
VLIRSLKLVIIATPDVCPRLRGLEEFGVRAGSCVTIPTGRVVFEGNAMTPPPRLSSILDVNSD